MSRTKRIYNRQHWKWHAEQSLRMRYTSPGPAWFTRESNGTILAGFVYHPYHELCMGCCDRCGSHRIRERATRRRKLKYEEQHYIKHWREEIDERDCLQEEAG